MRIFGRRIAFEPSTIGAPDSFSLVSSAGPRGGGVTRWPSRNAFGQSQDYPLALDAIVREVEGKFTTTLLDGTTVTAQFLLLSPSLTGVPEIPGFVEFYGRGVQDHWSEHPGELIGESVVVYGRDLEAVRVALALRQSTAHVGLCTDGIFLGGAATRAWLDASGVKLLEKPIAALTGDFNRRVDRINFADDTFWPCRWVFLPESQAELAKMKPRPLNGGTPQTDGVGRRVFTTVADRGPSPYALEAIAAGVHSAERIEQALQARDEGGGSLN